MKDEKERARRRIVFQKKSQISLVASMIILVLSASIIGMIAAKVFRESEGPATVEACRLSIFKAAFSKIFTVGQPLININCEVRDIVFEDEKEEEINKILTEHLKDCISLSAEGTLDWTESPHIAWNSGKKYCIRCSSFEFGEKTKKEYDERSIFNYMNARKFKGQKNNMIDYIVSKNTEAIADVGELWINVNSWKPIDKEERYLLVYRISNVPYFQGLINQLGINPGIDVPLPFTNIVFTTDLQSLVIQHVITLLPTEQAYASCDILLN